MELQAECFGLFSLGVLKLDKRWVDLIDKLRNSAGSYSSHWFIITCFVILSDSDKEQKLQNWHYVVLDSVKLETEMINSKW